MKRHCISIFFYLTLLFPGSSFVFADEVKTTHDNKSEWSLGLGLGVFEYYLYPGAKETNQLIVPAPYFTYRSEKLEVDQGIKGFLYHSEDVELDIAVDFGLPGDSDDALVRQGMPDLDFMFQLGPSLEFMLNDKNKNYFDARFEIPLSMVFVTDFRSAENIGYLLEPHFSLNHRRLAKTGLSQTATLGLKFATQDFHAYYYDVAAQFSTPARPEYESDGGFGGAFINYRMTYKTSDFVYWMFLRYQSLNNAVFEDSPLLVEDDYYFFGIGFAWIFASSF